MRKIITILVLQLLFISVYSQNNKLIPREIFFNEDERKEMFKINPEGTNVFYIKNMYKPGKNLFIFKGEYTTL